MIEKYVDAEELKRLLSTLGIILGFLLIAGLFASIVVPGLRNANKPETPTPIFPVGGETGWLDPAEAPPQKGGVIQPVDPQTLIKATPELVSKGKTLFEANCTPCHGTLGHGDGPAASTMSPRPRNFTSPDGWANGYGLPGIYKTLSVGIKGTSMASFDYLTKKDRMAMGHYIQSLGAFPKRESAQAIADLSKELASAGEKIPNRIPVSMAMAMLEKEFSFSPPLVADLEDQSPGAKIFRLVVIDPPRAAQVLTQSRLWRTSTRDLAAAILLDTPGNGFSVNTATLSPAEWQTLYLELLSRIKTQ
jgi:mono/diheme cytochrome c family protein